MEVIFARATCACRIAEWLNSRMRNAWTGGDDLAACGSTRQLLDYVSSRDP